MSYFPLVQRESTFRKLAGGFLDQVFDGALGEYVARALQSRRPSLEELEELERMIGEAKKESPGHDTSRSKEGTVLASRFASWEHLLTDLYLLSTVLLLAGMTVVYRLKQPARRIAVARSIPVGLFSLAIIAIVPGWPRIAAFRWPGSAPIFEPQVESPCARFDTARGKSAEQVDMNVANGQPREPEIAPPPAYADARV